MKKFASILVLTAALVGGANLPASGDTTTEARGNSWTGVVDRGNSWT